MTRNSHRHAVFFSGAEMPEPERFHLTMPVIKGVTRQFFPLKYSEKFHPAIYDELLYVISGSVRVRLKSGKEYTAEKNDLLLLPKGTIHKDIFKKEAGLEVFFIEFTWNELNELFSASSYNCTANLSSKEKSELNLLLDMFRQDIYQNAANLSMAEGRLAHLLAILWRNTFCSNFDTADNSDTYSRITTFACNYMTTHMAENITIDVIAEKLKVSRSTIIRAFHDAEGMSFNNKLRSIRMNEAYALLQEHSMTAAECAVQCGYQNPAYFSKEFKKYFGFSPKNIK